MKTKFFPCLLFLTFTFYLFPCTAQVPIGFNYQAIARDASGKTLANQSLPVKIDIVTALTGGTLIYEESFPLVTTDQFGLISIVIGSGTPTGGSAASFSAIDWKAQTLYLKTIIQYPGTTWTTMGTSQIMSVPYSLVARDVVGPLSKLGISGTTDIMDEALFEVKNKAGNTVFAVYNEGIRAYVGNGSTKGVKGGFSVGGYDATKSGTVYDIFVLSTDSARIYLDSKPQNGAKGVKGGFSVGGYDMTKAGPAVQNYLAVSKDSVRIYIDSNPSTKGVKGGFSVGGYDMTKGGTPVSNYLNVETNANGVINPSQNRILWYPLKNAFLTGRVRVGTPDSVGVNSFATGYESKSRGMYSQAMGFKAVANGDYSTAIGKKALANSINSFAFGEGALAGNAESYALGKGAIASGYRSFAFGSAGLDSANNVTDVARASGDYSFAIGQGSQAKGRGAVAIGLANNAQGDYSVAMGYKVNAIGRESTAFGFGSTASAIYANSFGYYSTASGLFATAIGDNTEASGSESLAMGSGTIASGGQSTAMGYYSKANGPQSTALGFETIASGPYAFAIGSQSTASNNCSIVLGYKSSSGGYSSTAMGAFTTASGDYSTTMGFQTLANRIYSTAMGSQTKATGGVATAMGDRTIASGTASTSMGVVTTGSGDYSVAMGIFTVAKPIASVVLGQFNDTTCSVNGKISWVATDPLFIVGNGTASVASNALTVLKNGKTAIGHSSPTQMLDVNGNARFRGVSSGTFGNNLNIMADGTLTTATSDISMKENINQISDALVEVMNLRGVFFNWKNDPAKTRQIGMIAQEVEPVVPEIVFTNPVDGLKGINYSQASALFVEAIKEQQKQIEKQQQQITNQQKEIDELKTIVSTLVADKKPEANK